MRSAPIAAVVGLVVSLLAAAAAVAEDGCRKFAWPLGREIDLFADGFMADVVSESTLPREGVFAMLLQPVSRVIYAVAPERGRDDGLGGVVTLEWVAAGRYQVTVSADAWIDAVQNGKRVPVLASSRREDCPGIRQSLQFEAKGVPLTLQFGGAAVRRLNVSVLRVHERFGRDGKPGDPRQP